MRRNRTVIEILTIIALVMVLGLIGAITVAAAGGALSRIRALRVTNQAVFDSAVSVDGAMTLNDTLSVGGATDMADTLDVTGALTAGNALSVTTFLKLAPATTISLTDGMVLTPTASYQPIQSAGSVTATLSATGFDIGTMLRLINTANTSIIISETATADLSGQITLGQRDSLLLLFDGTRWVQMATSNN